MKILLRKAYYVLNPWAGRRAEREAWHKFGDAAIEFLDAVGCPGCAQAEHDQLQRDVDEFIGVFDDGMLADSLGERLTCTEVDALARLFARAGHPDAAELWLKCHAEGDEWGDLHRDYKDEKDAAGTVVDLSGYVVELAA
ncbi:hypothetical protein ACFXAF_00390 [Kitasatospora sp. NPDC059463]|uniref:hypothetical protein n=1 Tax=unclassified Kitasatospora TaxID=2633591 RepID=UPI0036BC38FA